MELPIYVFWELVMNVNRISADEDLRLLRALSQSMAGNPAEYAKLLDQEKGEVFKLEGDEDETIYDADGVAELRALMTGA